MKSIFTLLLFVFAFGISECQGNMVFLFEASSNPGSSPDSTTGDDVWSVANSGGGGDFLGDSAANGGGSGAGAGSSAWGLFSNGNGGSSEMVASVTSLIGQDISLTGEMISLDFDNGFIGNGNSVGVQFLNGSGLQTELQFTGGDSEYRIFDGANVGTGVGFTADGLNLKVNLTDSNGGYQFLINGVVVRTGNLASGAGIDSIRVFNAGAGAGSDFDVFANSLELTVVPEPATIGTFGIALAALVRRRRRV